MFNFLQETFRLGVKNLGLHKLRSLLTALGIIFGVVAVISMVAIGEGAKRDALEQLQQLGSRNVLVRSIKPPESSDAGSRANPILNYGLDGGDLSRFEDMKRKGVIETIVPLRDAEQKVVRNQNLYTANAIGTTPEVFDVVNLRLARGRYFDQVEYDAAAPVCVVGHKAIEQMFPFEDPLGETVRVGTTGGGTVLLTVVGVLEPTGLRAGSEGAAMMSRDLDMDIYFPLTSLKAVFKDRIVKRLALGRETKEIVYSEIWLRVKDQNAVERVAADVGRLLTFHQKGGGTDLGGEPRLDVEVKAPIQILRAAERTQRLFNFIMGGIAFFTLIVGGIGIMNIMLASVTERTREIGIRRALGAKRRHITLQFLVETTVISVTAGLIGIAVGVGLVKLVPAVVNHFDATQTYRMVIAVWSVVGSFIVSALIGVAFGLYPAMKAARMSPIEALRHE